MSRSHHSTLLYSFDTLSLPGSVKKRILDVLWLKPMLESSLLRKGST
jgi:hypothetical protein